jgi:CRISPR-associated protein Csb2
MLAVAIEFLMGRSVATSFNDRDQSEWPPHPARLFSALVSAHHECGSIMAEREALVWLERQPPPSLCASASRERTTVTVFVPVNDSNEPHNAPSLGEQCPLPRGRQPRTFPATVPDDPVVHVIWPHADPESQIKSALASLIARVTYLGHSSSVVHVSLCDEPPPPTYEPAEDGNLVLRVPGNGQLEALEHAHAVFLRTGVRGPLPCRFQRYCVRGERPGEARPELRTVFGDMVVFRRLEGPTLPLSVATIVTGVLRAAAMATLGSEIPEVLSGHRPDGSLTERPHVAFIPLPDVGHRHARGHLLGVAAVLPRDLLHEDRRTVLRALGGVERLTMGRVGAWSIERVGTDAQQRGLRAETWTGPSRCWASVTPMVLERFPNEPYGFEAASSVAASCGYVGLPRPVDVLVSPVSSVLGAPPWHHFRRGERETKLRRPLVHVALSFAEPVWGPVLLGAGRYRGLGLCRPIESPTRASAD